MGNDRQLSAGARELYTKFTNQAGSGKHVDLTMQVLHDMGITLSGVLVAHLIELKEAGLIRYHVNDIPSVELLLN